VGVLSTQFLQQLRQNIRSHHCRSAADAQTPAFCACQLGNLIERRIMIPQNLARALEQMLARFGQHYPPRRAHEEFCSQFILQLPDLHANRGLSYVYALRGGSERAQFGNREKGS
jgi:hypothetical protein